MNSETTDGDGPSRVQDRQHAEREFHDRQYAGRGEERPAHYRIHPTYPVFLKMLELMGHRLRGGEVLEYGCGAGWVTAELASRGGRVSAFDISSEAVARTTAFLGKHNLLDGCSLRVMGGEKLDTPMRPSTSPWGSRCFTTWNYRWRCRSCTACSSRGGWECLPSPSARTR